MRFPNTLGARNVSTADNKRYRVDNKVTKRLYSAQKGLRRVSANLVGNWRRQLAARRKVIIVLNPAAGGDHPILRTMNSVFQPSDLNWDIDLTHRNGDGWRLAQRAIAKGASVVGVYGGDGTVTEVASGLVGSRVPLGILPGGTSNVISMSLGIPRDLEQACSLIANPDTPQREFFLGQVNQGCFTQIIGIGMEASMIEGATREAKDRLGWLAYGLAALQALTNPTLAHYHLELDGSPVDIEGITCLILQVDNLGIPALSATPPGARHGLLDVVVIRKIDFNALVGIAATFTGTDVNLLNVLATQMVGSDPNFSPLPHWQARQVRVTADPPQPVQADGELLGSTPIQAHILPRPVHVLVPAPV